MSTQESLIEEIKQQPETVLREVRHYLKFLTRQREEEAWADVLPTREVEQEVLINRRGRKGSRRGRREPVIPPRPSAKNLCG